MPEDRDEAVAQAAERDASAPFDLSTGPLLRATLLVLGEQQFVVLLAMHHIVSDGWSTGILVRELASLYEAFAADRPSPLPELPVQYSDYAHWQRANLSGAPLERLAEYWKQQLAGLEPLELPADRPRGALHLHQGGMERFELSAELTQSVHTLGGDSGATLFMTLLAAFQTLLSRYADTDDVAVGVPVAGRNRPEIEDLIGFFVNTLVMRTDLGGNPRFSELLSRVRRVAVDAYAHQEMPFDKLVELLEPDRDLSRTPLFQVMFVLQNLPDAGIELPGGLTFSPLEQESHWTKFDLTLFMWETDGRLAGCVQYNRHLFEPETIRRLVGHFEKLLCEIAAAPDTSLAQLPLMEEQQRQNVLHRWNATERAFPEAVRFHELFEQQAECAPDRVAIEVGGETWSYAELNERANRLAHLLRAKRVGRETPVAIALPRSPDFLASALAVMKAGGAYVPLDPAQPSRRAAMVLADAGAPLMISRGTHVEQFAHCPAEILDLDAVEQQLAARSPENLAVTGDARNGAYIIFTSGSTGRPKGVVVSHESLVNYCAWYQSALPAGGLAKPAVTNFAFDASIKQLLTPLCHGETVWLLDEETIADPPRLVEALASKPRVHLNCVPSLWRMLLSELEARGEDNPLPSVQLLSLGGEALDRPLVERTWSILPDVRIFNLYGPTETTVNATAVELQPAGPISIGSPVANTQAYVLDRRLEPLPPGMPGELYVGGVAVARGYVNSPDVTAEAFLPDPYGTKPGSRLYKTGDRCRWLSDGRLEFLGRLDDQVKLRGYRIEPDEIREALLEEAALHDAAVIVRNDSPGGARLVAYLVPREQAEVDVAQLRHGLRSRLPEHMLPAAFVTLAEMPLTATGKLDRAALPAPERESYHSGAAFLAARNELEQQLAELWADVLSVEAVGIHDNFFQLGGNSLLATQLLSRVRSTLQADVPLRELFAGPTVAELATAIERAGGAEPLPPIPRVSRDAPLPLSFAQQRIWFVDQLLGENAFYNMPIAVRLHGRLDLTAVRAALQSIAERHETLRTTFSDRDGTPLQAIFEHLELPVEIADLSHLVEGEREAAGLRQAAAEAQTPFDLQSGPLLRAKVFRLGEADHVVLLVMHHIISDGWSLQVLLAEFTELYRAAIAHEPAALPELPIQYVDFAQWQRAWLSGARHEEQLGYWKQQLAELPALELPTDRPRGAVQSLRGAQLDFTIEAELYEGLQALSQATGATLFMTALAAYQALLARYARQQDVAVGVPIAGRRRAELEGLIGFFVNNLVLRTDLSGNPTFRELIARARDIALAAYAHQDLPYEQVAAALRPQRAPGEMGLFNVAFSLQAGPRQQAELPGGLNVEPLRLEGGTARCDLTLFLSPQAGLLQATLEYNTDLFEAATIARIAAHYQLILRRMVDNPDERLLDRPLVRDEQAGPLLPAWSPAGEPASAGGNGHDSPGATSSSDLDTDEVIL